MVLRRRGGQGDGEDDQDEDEADALYLRPGELTIH